jgi:hypothetical protein
MLWRVQIQAQRWQGSWRTTFVGNEEPARKCYRDLFRRRARGNLVLLRGEQLVLWATRHQPTPRRAAS